MGRSVATYSDDVIYFEMPECDYGSVEEVVETIRSALLARYPSFYVDDDWVGREGRVILRNGLVRVVFSCYGNMAALSILPDEDYLDIAQYWIGQTLKGMKQALSKVVDVYYRVGTMSNGVGVYRRAEGLVPECKIAGAEKA